MLNNSERRFNPLPGWSRARPNFPLPALFAFLLCLAALLISAPAVLAQGSPPVSGLSSNRFLFIVDTSAAMKRMAPDILKIVAEVVNSSASGQLRTGDSLGLWTFNEEVYSELPAQTWNFEQRDQIGLRLIDFLRHRRLEKTSHLDRVTPDMLDVIKASDIITIFIISNGEGKFRGTPFDAEINAQYKQSLKDMGSSRMPIVTVLQAKGGHILKYTMNVYPWPVVIPELPLAIKLPPGSLPPPTPAPAPITQTPSTVNHPAGAAVAPPVISNPPPQTAGRPEVGVPIVRSTPAAAPWPKSFVVPTPPPTEAPPPLVIPDAKPPVVTPQQFVPPNVVANKPPPPVQPAPTGPPPLVNAGPPSALGPPFITKSAPPVVNPPRINPPLIAPPQSRPAPLAGTPAPPIDSQPPPASAPGQAVAPPVVAPASSPMPATNSAAQFAMVTPEIIVRSKTLLFVVVALVLVALLLTGLILHRYYYATGPSLITRSMGNKRK